MTIWGNHSATQYPDLFNALVRGQSAAELINDQAGWSRPSYPPCRSAEPQ
jgi:malate dehydrogenase